MLTEIRDRSSGLFAYVIAGLIIVPMAFWGVQEYANPDANPSLVEVGDQKITQAGFQAQFNNEQQRMRQAMGENVNNDYLSSDGFRENVLQQMINRALLEQIAEDQNYRIGDAQLAEEIKNSELFQIDGKFDQAAYDQYARGTQFSKTRYEKALRGDKVLGQITSGYQESSIVLTDEMRDLLEIQAEKRSFDLVTIKQSDYLSGVEVNAEEIQEYYNANLSQFLEQEKMSISYVELNIDQISEDIEVDDDELLVIYEQSVESYISAEQRDTRHILLSTNNGEDDDVQRAKAEQLLAEINNGADFSVLAQEHSLDPSSAAKGGSLGLIERDQMVAKFDKAAFELAEGVISEPIKTEFGYHLIQVVKIITPVQQTFEEVKFDLRQEELDRLAEEALLEQADQLRDLAFEQADNLEAIAEQLGLTIFTSEMFDRNRGEGIASSAIVRNAAFSDEVLIEDINTEPLEVSDGQYIVLRKAVYQASEPSELAKVSEQIKSLVLSQKATAATQLAGAALLDKAESDWLSIVADESNQVSSHSIALIDNSREVPASVIRQISTMQINNDAPSLGFIEDRNGDFHLIRLTNVEAGNVNTISAQIKDSTRRILSQRNGQALLSTYIKSLSDTLAPEINRDLL